jgi:oxygen-independent coproporphyrinogen-3 oxidase
VAAGDAVMERREIARDEVGFEFMLNALRLTGGVPAPLFAERTGHPLALVAPRLADGVRRGLIDADPARIVATEAGQRFLNTTLEMFLPAAAREAPECGAPVAFVEAPR